MSETCGTEMAPINSLRAKKTCGSVNTIWHRVPKSFCLAGSMEKEVHSGGSDGSIIAINEEVPFGSMKASNTTVNPYPLVNATILTNARDKSSTRMNRWTKVSDSNFVMSQLMFTTESLILMRKVASRPISSCFQLRSGAVAETFEASGKTRPMNWTFGIGLLRGEPEIGSNPACL